MPPRNIVFAIIHLITYSKFINNHQPAINIVSTVAWQSVLLSYNLISATSPMLKGFTEGFMTAGTSLGYVQERITTGGGSGVSGGYELHSLTKTKSRSKISQPDVANSQSQAVHFEWNTKSLPKASKRTSKDDLRCYNESASIASHESQRIMIKREWKASTE